MDLNELGCELARLRLAPTRLPDYPCLPPENFTQAYQVQDSMAAHMGSEVVGWKIGVTSKVAREMLGMEEPLSGPLFADFILPSPAKFKVETIDLRIIEAEVGFRMKHSLEPRNEPYSKQEAMAAIATVHPVFEVVNKRLPGDLKDNACWLIADGGVDQGFIYGPGTEYDPAMDLAAETVRVTLDGKFATDGIGANALGNPLNVVVWLANHLSARNITLNAGDWVSTGLIADVVVGDAGSIIIAEFETLGSIRLELI
jgi:2-keto-4-pentenoate hydratase